MNAEREKSVEPTAERSSRLQTGKKSLPRNGRDEPYVMPQRGVDAVRRGFDFISRRLWRIKFLATENIPPTGGVIIAANHQTYFDPFWLSIPVPRPMRYLAWDAAFDWFLVGRIITCLGAWPLQVTGTDVTAIKRAQKWLGQGGALVIFPEGRRALPAGELWQFKAGAARLALETNTPLLPVTIRGGNRVWAYGHKLPRVLRQVEVIYHPLIEPTVLPAEDTRAAARRITQELAAVINRPLKNKPKN